LNRVLHSKFIPQTDLPSRSRYFYYFWSRGSGSKNCIWERPARSRNPQDLCVDKTMIFRVNQQISNDKCKLDLEIAVTFSMDAGVPLNSTPALLLYTAKHGGDLTHREKAGEGSKHDQI
jgi:hypothetical protein